MLQNILQGLGLGGMGSMDWIDLAQERDRWQASVTTVMTFGFHNIWGMSWLAEDLLASEEGICSLELVSWLVR
jgi:hypothetical protein